MKEKQNLYSMHSNGSPEQVSYYSVKMPTTCGSCNQVDGGLGWWTKKSVGVMIRPKEFSMIINRMFIAS